MSYDLVETAVQSILWDLTSEFVSHDHVTRGDWRVLDSGAEVMAVLYGGLYNQTDQNNAESEFEVTYTVKLDLVRKYVNEGTTRVDFVKSRDAVLQQIMQYPMLHALAGNTARLGNITSDAEPAPVYGDDGKSGPFFLLQTFTLPVSEILAITPKG